MNYLLGLITPFVVLFGILLAWFVISSIRDKRYRRTHNGLGRADVAILKAFRRW